MAGKNFPATRAPDQPAAEWVETSKLVPWARNPRRNDKAVKKIAESIKRFGFGAPIVARRENGEVIAGHTRLKAAIRLKLSHVPVRYLDLNERESHLLAMADNKLGELAEWDQDEVARILSEYGLSEVAVAGWDFDELAKMAKDLAGDAEAEDGSPKLGDGLTYSVVVECADEGHQTELLMRFEDEGLKCKPLVT